MARFPEGVPELPVLMPQRPKWLGGWRWTIYESEIPSPSEKLPTWGRAERLFEYETTAYVNDGPVNRIPLPNYPATGTVVLDYRLGRLISVDVLTPPVEL